MAGRDAEQGERRGRVKLVWTQLARTDRKQIGDFVAQDNPAAACALDELFSNKASGLIDRPGIGRPGREAGTRELIVHQNYILIYDVTSTTVRVLRVLHAARKWPPGP